MRITCNVDADVHSRRSDGSECDSIIIFDITRYATEDCFDDVAQCELDSIHDGMSSNLAQG